MKVETKALDELMDMYANDGSITGLFKVVDEDYHAFKAIGSTAVKAASISMADFKQVYDPDPTEPRKPTANYFNFGRAVHAYILDKEEFAKSFIEKPKGIDLRTKAGKVWREENARKTVLSEWDMFAIETIAVNVHSSELFCDLTNDIYHTELAAFWTHDQTGLQCKGKFDLYSPLAGIFDLKTTQNKVTDRGVKNAIKKYQYDLQAVHYSAGASSVMPLQSELFHFGFVEKVQPFSFRAAILTEETLKTSRENYEAIMSDIDYCLTHDFYPGPGNGKTLEIDLNQY